MTSTDPRLASIARVPAAGLWALLLVLGLFIAAPVVQALGTPPMAEDCDHCHGVAAGEQCAFSGVALAATPVTLVSADNGPKSASATSVRAAFDSIRVQSSGLAPGAGLGPLGSLRPIHLVFSRFLE